ncbi:hypothetical protein [Novosphingobium mangrovi (ex Huang et al. 2023)]|uniref:FMN-binding protein n=1 Tax=Novosphingobium mangrovi (ex Huang et al. 2023) TaxID=2976432 RepID=A0ABT2I1Z0_9SPHN|nr:hypothetical protein [Novosphingobium mangrovi (ex Huang et al. 2023)]MCT2398827.1 hypothetical protein [Novosphingobium mangrovi (ex Huang et al. 2023)]
MFKKLLAVSALALAASPVAAHAGQESYAEGQVWQYTTRAQDKGSLLKIQKIDIEGGRRIYHVSVIGVHMGYRQEVSVLPHLPVSEETLDASVTRQVHPGNAFSAISADADIAEWRMVHGGVLTTSLVQALDQVDTMLSPQL